MIAIVAVTLYYYLGERLAALKKGTNLRYLSQDHLTGTAVMSDSSGNVVGTIKYYPYGATRASSGSIETEKKFTGQRLDFLVDLYYYGARYYDLNIGRFISVDTVFPNYMNPQSLNRSSYALNNPLHYIDSSGLQTEPLPSIPWNMGGVTVHVNASMLEVKDWAWQQNWAEREKKLKAALARRREVNMTLTKTLAGV